MSPPSCASSTLAQWTPEAIGLGPWSLLAVTAAATLILAGIGYVLGRHRSLVMVDRGVEPHSTPDYYGWYAVLVMLLPGIVIALAAAVLSYAGVFAPPAVLVAAAWVALPALILAFAVRSIKPELRARVWVERAIYVVLLAAASISVLTTIGILLSVLFESIRFFRIVSVAEFLFGTTWDPGGAFLQSAGRGGEAATDAKFGAVPLFAGTFLITGIAMAVAVPIGLLSAIYMSEYAHRRARRLLKPMLEILAGIPTVVYGFFAAITVAPIIVRMAESVGLSASFNNALTPGLIMGVMIIPFMSSLCDDVIAAVPQALRRGSYAMGATQSETITRVVLPAALPGIVSAFLLAVSRAIGETMIVVMAAGLQANLSWNPLEIMTTVTVKIVDSLTGDLEYDNPQTLSAFALGLTLLMMTLALNVISAIVIRKFRLQYEAG